MKTIRLFSLELGRLERTPQTRRVEKQTAG